jgi:hypothetical protein
MDEYTDAYGNFLIAVQRYGSPSLHPDQGVKRYGYAPWRPPKADGAHAHKSGTPGAARVANLSRC